MDVRVFCLLCVV